LDALEATILRILVVDDNQMIRDGITTLLSAEPNWEVCGEAENGSEALQKTRQLHPDLILLDVSMPGINGLAVTRLLRHDFPRIKILVMSNHDLVQLLPSVVEAGGDGCVDKTRLVTGLLDSIKTIL